MKINSVHTRRSIFRNLKFDPETLVYNVFRRQELEYGDDKSTRILTEGLHVELKKTCDRTNWGFLGFRNTNLRIGTIGKNAQIIQKQIVNMAFNSTYWSFQVFWESLIYSEQCNLIIYRTQINLKIQL